jgi:hypothetical protein
VRLREVLQLRNSADSDAAFDSAQGALQSVVAFSDEDALGRFIGTKACRETLPPGLFHCLVKGDDSKCQWPGVNLAEPDG